MTLLLQDTLVISPATVQRIDAEIEEIKNNTDVADVVADKAELDAYDTSRLTDNAIIKVLQDESVDDASTYYRYIKSSDTFELIGTLIFKALTFSHKAKTLDIIIGKIK